VFRAIAYSLEKSWVTKRQGSLLFNCS